MVAPAAQVVVYLALVAAVCILVVLKPFGASRRQRAARVRIRLTVGTALFLVLLPAVTPAFPNPLLPWLSPGTAKAAEVLNAPEFIDVSVLPNGQVGTIFVNDAGGGVVETRFKRYFVEQGMDQSVQLSTASSWYPQLATFQGKVIAAYVDNRSGPTQNELLFRISSDSGASWGSEYAPFGVTTFDTTHSTPLVVASRDGATLYVFSAVAGAIPQYRYTQDPTLGVWTGPLSAGDASMHSTSSSPCAGSTECSRAHNFEFTETATVGQWLFIVATTADEEHYGCGRGTQVGALGGSWSATVGHGQTCDLSGNQGGSRATAFVDRSGNVYFLRTDWLGTGLYFQKSTDGGLTWQPRVYAYANALDQFTVGSPVGLYVPGYTKGEYIWYAGFGGIGFGNDQNAARVIPLWTTTQQYGDTGTARLFGTLGGDWDFGAAYPYTFGRRDIPTGIGAYKTSAEDLAIPGRLLNFSFSRYYSSADNEIGPLGPAWTHSFNWALSENGNLVQIRRGDGRRDIFTRNPDTTYTPPPNVFDVLTKNPDGTFTLTLKNQTKYEFGSGLLTRIHEPAGNQITFGYTGTGANLVRSPVGGTASYSAISYFSSAYIPDYAANGVVNNTNNAGVSWARSCCWQVGDWWRVTWTVAQSLTRVRLWDRADSSDYFGDGHLLLSDGSTVYFSGLPDDAGPNGENYLDVAFPRKTGITSLQVISDSGGRGTEGFAEVESYDDETATAVFPHARLSTISDTVGRQVTLTYSRDLSASAGTNVAAGKSYQKSVPADNNATGEDTNGTELADGTLGNPNNGNDANWQTHTNLGATPLDVTIDLGTAQRVGVVRSYHYQDPNLSMFRPATIELLTSTDNVQFTSRGKTVAAAAVNDSGNRWRYEFDLAGVSARWVRFRLTTGGSVLVSSEMQVFAEDAAPVTLPLNYAERVVAVQDPIGRKISYGYDQLGRLTRVVDKIGNAAGQDPTLHSWHYAYDGQTQHIISVVDPDGRTRVGNTFNSEGRLATQTDGAGNTSNFTYGSQITMVTDPRGHLTTQLFDPRWRLQSQSDTVGGTPYVLQYVYGDAFSNLTATIDRNGNETDYTYDNFGNVLTKTDPQVPPAPRYVTAYVYDARNNVTQITDARNFVTTNTYDPLSNVRLSTTQQITTGPATYATSKWEYGDPANPGLPTKIISPRGNTTGTPNYTYSQSVSYDGQGNMSQRIDADTYKTTYGYDGVSRQTTMVDPDGYSPIVDPAHHTWTTGYDENDRVTQSMDPLSHSTLASYDGAGDRLSATDRDGNVTTYAYDGAARLASVKQKPDPVGQPSLVYTTSVVRDGDGNATQVTQGNNVVTNYGYDDLNRLASFTTHPTGVLNLTTSYVLDGNGNPTQRTTADTVQTNYQYDALSRLKQVSAAGLSTISYGYDELSHRTSMTDGTGSSTFSFDGLGRLTQAVQPNGTVGYGYDLDSNRTTLTYPTVGSINYVFSPASRLSSLTDWGSRQSTYTFTASGLAKTLTVPGGVTTTYGYDNAQRLLSLVNSTGAGTITSDIYTLDNEGNRTAIDEIMPDGTFASVRVNTDTGTVVQDHPAIAIGADNASYLIWDDARSGNADIYFSRRDAVSGAWSTPNDKVNNDTGTRMQINPAIATDSSSNAYAVWEDSRDGASNKIDTNIYSSKRPAGGSWLANAKVNDDTSQNPVQRNPRIAGTAAGMETAVWVDLRASQNNIYASQLTTAGGTTWAANKKVTDNTAALKDFPDVTVDPANTAYAVWQDSRNGNADIFFSSLTNGGSAWAANEKISDDPGTTAQTKARIGVDSSGNLIATWIDARSTPAQIRARRRPAGSTWTASAASVVVSPSPANAQSLALSVRPDGFAWAVWGDTRGTSQDIWGSRYDPNLNTWSAPLRLDDDPGTTAAQLNPTVAFGSTETMVSWRDNRLSANGDTQARRILFIKGMTDHFALGYDGLNRLKSVSGPVSEGFTLDSASNITSRTGPSQTDTYDQANRLTSDGASSYTWSNADRLTNRGADTFSYDALDRMTSSTISGSARTYAYNGDGILQSRTGAGATSFLWDPSSSAARELKQGNDNIVYGLGPLYVVKADSSTLTLARDGSKNVRAEVTSSGGVAGAFRYRGYGQIAQAVGLGPTYLGFASQTTDPSGLLYMRARWYDPVVGRFLSRDPIKGDAGQPSSLNAYDYAAANPILLMDPTGACPFCITAGIGALVGGIAGLVSYEIGCNATASCTVAGAAGATASGAVTGALIGLAGPMAASLIAATPAVGAVSAAATAGLAVTIRAGIGTGSYVVGGLVTNAVDLAEGHALEFAPDLGDAAGSAVGAALGGTVLDAVFPLQGVNRLSQYMFAPRTWLSAGENMERFIAGATSAAVLDILGAEADTMRPQSPVQYDFSGLYFTQ